MLNRLLFRLRAAPLELGPLLGSWKLSAAVMVSGALYYGFLVIWSTSSPPHVVRNIASLLPFWLVYGLILLNAAVCLWRRWPALQREISGHPVYLKQPPLWEIPTRGTADRDGCLFVRQMGYRAVAGDDGACFGLRRRWAPLGTYLFHGAFFLVAAGFLLGFATRFESSIWVAEGEDFTGEPSQVLSQEPPRFIELGPPDVRFSVEKIVPEFWRSELLFTELRADLVFTDGSKGRTRINHPLWKGWGTFLRLSGFGYAPRYELLARSGASVESSFAKLRVFPPGQEALIVPETLPYRIYLKVYPDGRMTSDGPVSASLNLTQPLYEVSVFRGRLPVAQGILKPGEELPFEGLRLRFPEIRYWGEFSLLRDPGMPILLLGFLLALAGLVLTFRGKRAELVWRPAPDETGGVLQGWGDAEIPDGKPFLRTRDENPS